MQGCRKPVRNKKGCWLAASALLLAVCAEAAESDPLSRCTAITDREQRWRCYDEAAGAPVSREGALGPADDTCGAGYTALSRRWNTRPDCESRLYGLMPYKQNYLIARYSNSPNNYPTSANFGTARDQELEQPELKFQVSIKAKV